MPGEGGPPVAVESDISNIVTIVAFNNNNPVIVANIPAQTLKKGRSTAPLGPFTFSDSESDNAIGTAPKALSVSAAVIASTNPALTPQITFTFAGTGNSRTVVVTSTREPDRGGDCQVDGGGYAVQQQARRQHVPADGLHAGNRRLQFHGDGHTVDREDKRPAGSSRPGRLPRFVFIAQLTSTLSRAELQTHGRLGLPERASR